MTQTGDKISNLYRRSTSLSDNQVWPDLCAKASIDSNLFANFRKNPVYRKILEHVSQKQGHRYQEEIKRIFPDYLNQMNGFKANDNWGNPILFEYPDIGKISPTTLRYIKVHYDLIKLFEQLGHIKICEIGGGYGGQCRIINSTNCPSEYILVDIKQALMLSQRYLDNYILKSKIKYMTMNELGKESYDMIISNYAFSELPRDIQNVYLDKIILNCQRGYITYNEITPKHFNSYPREDLINIIPNSRIIPERPLTNKNNCIIVWGD